MVMSKGLDSKNRYLQSRESPISPWRTDSSQTPECFCAELTQKLKFLVLGSVSRCGRRQVVLSSEYVDGKGWGWECGKEAGRVERNSLSLVHTLLRWNKPRLRNAIFSHPSNKLYIQQISGTLPNHFFPLQSLKKLHLVGLNYRDIIQKMFVFISGTICLNLGLQKSLTFPCNLKYEQNMNSEFFGWHYYIQIDR